MEEEDNNEKHNPIYKNHVAKEGDTIYSLCKKHDITIDNFNTWNNNHILKKDKQYIVGLFHKPIKGETIHSICEKYGMDENQFKLLNDLKDDIISKRKEYKIYIKKKDDQINEKPKEKTIVEKAKEKTFLESLMDFGKKLTMDVNVIEFHTYSDGRVEKHIPKDYDDTLVAGKIKYFYHDDTGKEYYITDAIFHFAEKRKNGKKTTISKIPLNYIRTYKYPKGGNAQTAYVYSNSDILVKGTKYGIRNYSVAKGMIQLIKMPDSLEKTESKFKIFYKFKNSQRRYCNPETFAAFIGVLAKMSFEDVLCTGMCFADATSYPSLTHPNGDSVDTAYFSTLEREQQKVDAFHFFHFKHIYRGKTSFYGKLENSKYSDGHEDHLHAGDFDSNIVKKITV